VSNKTNKDLKAQQSDRKVVLEKGIQQGKAIMLAHLIELRFGKLSFSDTCRIAEAPSEILFAWGNNVLTAKTLDEVFN
jgi:hypothetical protein